jgi:hypothetical protein
MSKDKKPPSILDLTLLEESKIMGLGEEEERQRGIEGLIRENEKLRLII